LLQYPGCVAAVGDRQGFRNEEIVPPRQRQEPHLVGEIFHQLGAGHHEAKMRSQSLPGARYRHQVVIALIEEHGKRGLLSGPLDDRRHRSFWLTEPARRVHHDPAISGSDALLVDIAGRHGHGQLPDPQCADQADVADDAGIGRWASSRPTLHGRSAGRQCTVVGRQPSDCRLRAESEESLGHPSDATWRPATPTGASAIGSPNSPSPPAAARRQLTDRGDR
jgi:hypothetical protein